MKSKEQSLRQTIHAAIRKIAKKPTEVATETWGVFWDYDEEKWCRDGYGCVCPIGCVLLAKQPKVSDHTVAAAEALGVSTDWVHLFIDAFDYPADHFTKRGSVKKNIPQGARLGAAMNEYFFGDEMRLEE